jgi:hypothetical protein
LSLDAQLPVVAVAFETKTIDSVLDDLAGHERGPAAQAGHESGESAFDGEHERTWNEIVLAGMTQTVSDTRGLDSESAHEHRTNRDAPLETSPATRNRGYPAAAGPTSQVQKKIGRRIANRDTKHRQSSGWIHGDDRDPRTQIGAVRALRLIEHRDRDIAVQSESGNDLRPLIAGRSRLPYVDTHQYRREAAFHLKHG